MRLFGHPDHCYGTFFGHPDQCYGTFSVAGKVPQHWWTNVMGLFRSWGTNSMRHVRSTSLTGKVPQHWSTNVVGLFRSFRWPYGFFALVFKA